MTNPRQSVKRFTEPKSEFYLCLDEIIRQRWGRKRPDTEALKKHLVNNVLGSQFQSPTSKRFRSFARRLQQDGDELASWVLSKDDELLESVDWSECLDLAAAAVLSKQKAKRLQTLLDQLDLDSADALFEKEHRQISRTWYEKCRAFTVDLQKDNFTQEIREKVESHLQRFNFDAASKLFLRHKELLDECWYVREVDRARADLDKQTARRRALEQERRRKESAQSVLRGALENDFLSARALYESRYRDCIADSEYSLLKDGVVEDFRASSLYMNLDTYQAAVVGWDKGHLLVTARAGSGKTQTLIARTCFLILHCGVVPTDILILAFNKKAVIELKVRLLERLLRANDSFGQYGGEGVAEPVLTNALAEEEVDEIAAGNNIALPHILTFHALARAIALPSGDILYDDEREGMLQLSRRIQALIDDRLRDPEFLRTIRKTMLNHFREDWESILQGRFHLSRDEFLFYRRSLVYESLRGEYVKSYGEKALANFLFENDVDYFYEKSHSWDGLPYKPDFTIPCSKSSGLIIEYFGLSGQSAYDQQIQDKREYWRKRAGWELFEVYPEDVKSDWASLEERLRATLVRRGIHQRALTEDELWGKVKHRAVDNFSRTIVQFIGRAQKQELSPKALRLECKSFFGERAPRASGAVFAEVACELYERYLIDLVDSGDIDFDQLLINAAQKVSDGHSRFERRGKKGCLKSLRFILVDEYQDFSRPFYSLLKAILGVAELSQVMAVGDDWQAINGFAGSDLRYFHGFEQHFDGAQRLELPFNYRSHKDIVEAGNDVMDGLGKPARAKSEEKGLVRYVDLAAFDPSELEKAEHSGDNLSPAILRIIGDALSRNLEVALLTRRRSGVPQYVAGVEGKRNQTFIEWWEKILRGFFDERARRRIRVSNVHQFKGLQADVVIVVDALNRSYPLVHPNWIFFNVFGDTPMTISKEEQRLFYVALTRAAKELYILTDSKDASPFLEPVFARGVDKLDMGALSPILSERERYVVEVGNAGGASFGNGTYPIRDLLKDAGYAWRPRGWPCWSKAVAREEPLELVSEESWANKAKEVEIRVYDAQGDEISRARLDEGRLYEIGRGNEVR